MNSSLRLEIAGINFSIKVSDKLIPRDLPLHYQSFLKREPRKTRKPDIQIEIGIKNIGTIESLHAIFCTGQSWTMYKDDFHYYVAYDLDARKKPYWLARTDLAFKKVTIYFNASLVNPEGSSVAVDNPACYPFDQIIVMYYLAREGGALIHAAGINFKGKGYVFLGRSGAGKTTLSKQFIQKNYCDLLSDDRVIVRKIDDQFKVFGTPWPGEGGITSNRSLPLSGMFFLSHGDSNRIEELSPQNALEKLLPVVSIPWYDSGIMTEILSFCEVLISRIPVYALHFRPDTGVVNMLEEYIAKHHEQI